MDFTNREHSRHTSINKLEYENERLQNDLAKYMSMENHHGLIKTPMKKQEDMPIKAK
jgi:hypothetical protein